MEPKDKDDNITFSDTCKIYLYSDKIIHESAKTHRKRVANQQPIQYFSLTVKSSKKIQNWSSMHGIY